MDLPEHTIWFNNMFGWYMPSEKHVDSFPEGIHYRKLEWTEVRDDDDKEDLAMKDHDIVAKYVRTLIYGESKSQYQGEKDTWLEHDVTIIKNIQLTSQYGDSHMHIMQDADENIYVWTTGSKNLEVGSTVHMKMKVKEHKEYEGVKQTIVYYCRIK